MRTLAHYVYYKYNPFIFCAERRPSPQAVGSLRISLRIAHSANLLRTLLILYVYLRIVYSIYNTSYVFLLRSQLTFCAGDCLCYAFLYCVLRNLLRTLPFLCVYSRIAYSIYSTYSANLLRSTPTCSTCALKKDATLKCVTWLRILTHSKPNRYINPTRPLDVLSEVLDLNTYVEYALGHA
jgi:hypothetical protein